MIAEGAESTLRRNDSKPAWESQLYSEVFAKVFEEQGEFLEALYEQDDEAVVREGFDLILATAMLMTKHGFGSREWQRGKEEK